MIERIINIRLDGGANTQEYILDQSNLAKLRQVRGDLMESDSARLDLGNGLLLHSKFTGIRDLFNSGNATIIRNISYPNPNQSHFVSTDIIHEGKELESSTRGSGVLKGTFEEGGWFGRHLERNHPAYPVGYPNQEDPHPLSMSIDYNQHDATIAEKANFDYATPNPAQAAATIIGATDTRAADSIGRAADYIIQTKSKRNAYNNVVKSIYDTGVNNVTYQGDTFNKRCAYIARQINSGAETVMYNVRLGGFDTHSSQVAVLPGLLTQLNNGITSMVDDLEASGKLSTTVILVYTEFGRTLRSNASAGTDHGVAWDTFIVGPTTLIGSNQVIGTAYSFDPTTMSSGTAVDMQYDFRDVYATILKKGFGASISASGINNLLVQQ